MTLSKIVGAILLVVAGSGTALAQRSMTATAIPVDYPANRPAVRTVFGGGAGWHGPHEDDRDKDRHGDRRHHRGYLPFGGYGYWGPGGYVYSEESRDTYGYFATGGDVSLIEGEAYYDYDRSYPYDWFKEARPVAAAAPSGQADYRCQTSLVEGGRRGGKATVRVCRR